jgi:hypothetical protein
VTRFLFGNVGKPLDTVTVCGYIADMNTTTSAFQVNNKWFRTEQVTDSTGTYNAWIPCDAKGKNVDRCPVCGGHADHRQGLGCGL